MYVLASISFLIAIFVGGGWWLTVIIFFAVGVALNIMEEKKKQKTYELRVLRELDEIDQNGLPSIVSPVGLPADEQCCFMAPANFYQMRTKNSGVYGGASVSVRVAKGVSLRVGQYAPIGDRKREWTQVDAGHLYLTTKNIMFLGVERTKTISLEKIVAIDVYQSGFVLRPRSGQNLMFEVDRLPVMIRALDVLKNGHHPPAQQLDLV